MFFQLLGHQMLFGNLQLFLVRVRGQFDDFHTVEERRRNGVQCVGRRDKQNVR